VHHKVRTYKEYHSVCPSSELGLPPTPHPQASVPPPPCFWGEGHSLARKGLGESQFRRGAYTVVLFICTYFVGCTLCVAKLKITGSLSESDPYRGENDSVRHSHWRSNQRKNKRKNVIKGTVKWKQTWVETGLSRFIFLLHFISRIFLSNNIKYFVEEIYRKRPTFFSVVAFSAPYPLPPILASRIGSIPPTQRTERLFIDALILSSAYFFDILTPHDALKKILTNFSTMANFINPTDWDSVKMYGRSKNVCSSRDGVHLGPKKETCRQDILSQWID
jgi:hypothetical protein